MTYHHHHHHHHHNNNNNNNNNNNIFIIVSKIPSKKSPAVLVIIFRFRIMNCIVCCILNRRNSASTAAKKEDVQTMKVRCPLNASLLLLMLLILAAVSCTAETGKPSTGKTIYGFTVKTMDGADLSLADYRGKVILIVNVASKCGFTPQYKGLQELYNKYKNRGFVVLGFPCNQFLSQEPGTNDEIKHFCSITYGITFPMFDKIDVNGDTAHPLYKYLTSAKGGFITDSIKWNFTKFLIDRKGTVVKRYPPQTAPENMEEDIKKLL